MPGVLIIYQYPMENMEPVSRSGPLNPRFLSAIECVLGALVVIGYNVYHVIPNEVPILFIAGLISLRLRDGGWKVIGLGRPSSWLWTILIALAAAASRVVLGEVVVDPITSHFWPPAVAPSGAETIAGNTLAALKWLGLVWTFAAFGEEIAYRGYLLTRAADMGGRSKVAYWAALIYVSILFGVGHYYKGPSGMIDSGIAGLVLGSAYLLSGRNLWVCILAHGFIDSFGVIALYLGWAN